MYEQETSPSTFCSVFAKEVLNMMQFLIAAKLLSANWFHF